MDMLTLTATGNYRGTVHTVRAVVPPYKIAAMLVANPNSLAAADTDRYTLLRNWGWRVQFMKAAGASTDFDTAVAVRRVIYVPAHAVIGATTVGRLITTILPVVSENIDLASDMKVATAVSNTWSGTTMDVLQLTRTVTDDGGSQSTQTYTHYITSVFPVGSLAICTSPANLLYVQGTTLAPRRWRTGRARRPSRPCGAGVRVASDGRHAGPRSPRGIALGRGLRHLLHRLAERQRAERAAAGDGLGGQSWRCPGPGIAVWDTFQVLGMGLVDGYNSASGPYGGSNVNSLPVVATDSVMDGALNVSSGLVKGNAYVGPEANLGQVVNVSAGASLTGVKGTLTLDVPIPAPQPPASMGSSVGDRTYALGIYTVSGDATRWLAHDQRLRDAAGQRRHADTPATKG